MAGGQQAVPLKHLHYFRGELNVLVGTKRQRTEGSGQAVDRSRPHHPSSSNVWDGILDVGGRVGRFEIDGSRVQAIVEPADGPEGLIAVGFETRVRQQVVPISLGIERLWQEDRDAGNVEVAGFVIEAGGDLQSPGADTEPIEEAIIGIEPTERRIVVAETAKVAREQLGAKAQAWRQLLGKVDPDFAELEATVLGLREEVVVRGVDESLTDETVCFEVE